MSATINLGPKIAKVTRDMLDAENVVLDVESVYAELVRVFGADIFQSERLLAQATIKQRIKSHLKNAHSINDSEDGAQLKLLKDDVSATLSVRQDDGSYAYVPLRLATVDHIDAATAAKVSNIENARAALTRWTKQIDPIRAIMAEEKKTFAEAQKLHAERAVAKPKKKRANAVA